MATQRTGLLPVVWSDRRHGFARDAEHILIFKGDDTMMPSLSVESDDLRWSRPFVLSAHYELCANTLKLTYKIANTGMESRPYSLAFTRAFWHLRVVLYALKKREFSGGVDTLPIRYGTFDNDSICLENPKSSWFTLE